MKVQIKVGREWRNANATINELGHAVVKLKFPYEPAIFKTWRKAQSKRERGRK